MLVLAFMYEVNKFLIVGMVNRAFHCALVDSRVTPEEFLKKLTFQSVKQNIFASCMNQLLLLLEIF